MYPVPIDVIGQAVAHRPYRQVFVAGFDLRGADFGQYLLHAQEPQELEAQRPDAPAADDERDDRHALGRAVAQHIEEGPIIPARIAVQ